MLGSVESRVVSGTGDAQSVNLAEEKNTKGDLGCFWPSSHTDT